MKQAPTHTLLVVASLLVVGPSLACMGSIGDASGVAVTDATGTSVQAIRAPLRRLTPAEYSATVRDLFGDATNPGSDLPSEQVGNGFGNDAEQQSVSSLHAEQYESVADGVAGRATASAAALASWAPCVSQSGVNEPQCARTVIGALLPRAFRRPVTSDEIDGLVALQSGLRADASFAESMAGVVAAVLQSPDFLYRIERGEERLDASGRRRPTGHEMATRLSYLYWGTMPDTALTAAADNGELASAEGVMRQARRMLDDPRARQVVRAFFDGLLPINALPEAQRSSERYPGFSPAIGALMHEETQTFLEHLIFEGEGDYRTMLTAGYTFMNADLARFYGVTGPTGSGFTKVATDPRERRGLLTHASVLTGTTHSNNTSPVARGAYVMRKLMCETIPLPPSEFADLIQPPPPTAAPTARERFGAHRTDSRCTGCHQLMDPVGFALENYDAVGLWRDTENGAHIDATGSELPAELGNVTGPLDLVNAIADSAGAHACFAKQWASFGYGRSFGRADAGTLAYLAARFVDSGLDIKELLLALTQSDTFLYLPPEVN